MEIAGKTFLVTGGASGLGAATARLLEQSGARVTIADLPETNVTDEAAVQRLLDPLDSLHGAVNCAGVGASARVVGKDGEAPFPLDLFRAVIDVNLTGTFNVVRLAATGAGSHGQRLPSAEGGDAEAALNDVSPHDDALASAWYRSKVLPVLVRRVLDELKESA